MKAPHVGPRVLVASVYITDRMWRDIAPLLRPETITGARCPLPPRPEAK